MNKVSLAGYIANDPITNVTSTGIEKANFNIAVNDCYSYDQTYFIPCVAWRQTALYIGNNLKKGCFVTIDGRLVRRSYVNNENVTVYITEVLIDTIKNYGSNKNKKTDTENIEVVETVSINNINQSQQKPLEVIEIDDSDWENNDLDDSDLNDDDWLE